MIQTQTKEKDTRERSLSLLTYLCLRILSPKARQSLTDVVAGNTPPREAALEQVEGSNPLLEGALEYAAAAVAH